VAGGFRSGWDNRFPGEKPVASTGGRFCPLFMAKSNNAQTYGHGYIFFNQKVIY
jgi:hypothetical protein